MTRLDRSRYDASVIVAVGRERRSEAPAGGLQRPRHRRARRRDRRRRADRPPRRHPAGRRSTPTCTGPTSSERRPRSRCRTPAIAGRTSSRPSTRRASGRSEDRDAIRALTPEMDQLIAVSKAIERKIADERPGLRPCPAHLQRRRPRPLRPPGAVLHAPRRVRDGAGVADRRRRRPAGAGEGPPDAPRRVAARPARGSRRLSPDRRGGEPARCAGAAGVGQPGRPSGRLHRPPRRRARRSRPPSTSPSCRRIARPRDSRSSRRWRCRGRSSRPTSAGSRR